MGKYIGKKIKEILKDDIFEESEEDLYEEYSDEDESYEESEEDSYYDNSEDVYEVLGKSKDKKNKADKTKTDKKGKKKSDVKSFALVFCWLLFILLAVVFYFYFMGDLPGLGKKDDATTTESSTTGADTTSSNTTSDVVTEETTLGLSYEVNANPAINELISQFLSYIVAKDEAGIRTLVMDPNGNVQYYLDRGTCISNFTNINCYTLPGYTEDATLVYVIYNITIPDVVSEQIDIQQFYVINTESGYKVDNREYSPEVATYIEQQLLTEDIQNLYILVKDSIEQSIANDPTFAEFYEELMSVEQEHNEQ